MTSPLIYPDTGKPIPAQYAGDIWNTDRSVEHEVDVERVTRYSRDFSGSLYARLERFTDMTRVDASSVVNLPLYSPRVARAARAAQVQRAERELRLVDSYETLRAEYVAHGIALPSVEEFRRAAESDELSLTLAARAHLSTREGAQS